MMENQSLNYRINDIRLNHNRLSDKRGDKLNVEKIKERMNEKGLSLYKLSLKSNIPYSTLHDLVVTKKAKNPRIDTVIKIANGLEEKVENLI